MSRLSLRTRLVLAGAVAVVVSLGLAAAGLAALFGAHVERRAMAELAVQLDQVVAGLERDGTGRLVLARAPADPRFAQPLGGLYWQIEGPESLLRSRSLWDAALELPPDELDVGAVHAHHLPGPGRKTLLVLERSVTLPARLGGTRVRAAVAMDAAELDAAGTAFLSELAPYLGVLAAALIAAGWAQVTYGLRPLSMIGARVAAVRSGRSRRLGADFPAEVLPLAAELDALIEAREQDVERARARAADLAHGLKTPLQALLGEADRLGRNGDRAAAASLEDLARTMQRRVDRELARTRVAMAHARARSDVAEIARSIVSVVQRTPAGAVLDWRLEVPEGLQAAIDTVDLAEALGALVENAARYAATGVKVSASRVGDVVRVSVEDDGPGLPADRIDALVQRGASLDESSSQTGLGLAIARELVEAAGGSLELGSGSRGLVASLSLPQPPPAAPELAQREVSRAVRSGDHGARRRRAV